MLATIPEDAARKVADDIRLLGNGYIRVTSDGRAEHVPARDVMIRPMTAPQVPRSSMGGDT